MLGRLLTVFGFAGLLSLLLLSGAAAQTGKDTPATRHIDQILKIGSEGKGNNEASSAWKDLVKLGPDALLPTLAALDQANPAASNWLRTAVNAIAQTELRNKRPLPADRLEAFLKDTRHVPAARRLAYELLTDIDPKTPARLLPGMLNDPSNELRRDAIAAALKDIPELEKKDAKAAVEKLSALFTLSRDQDQTEDIAKQLLKKGIRVDLTAHFNLITKWVVVGPFDSTDGAGFAKAFDPEAKVDLKATYTGKGGKPISWRSWWSFDRLGVVDLNDAIRKEKFAAAYAFAAIESPEEREVDIRFGCICAVRVFLNGKEIFAREEYHHGQRLDQYIAKGTLKKGRNEILVKVCQNNQTDSWAQEWSFMLRICDATGGAVPFRMLSGE
jgi:hypothetical protein